MLINLINTLADPKGTCIASYYFTKAFITAHYGPEAWSYMSGMLKIDYETPEKRVYFTGDRVEVNNTILDMAKLATN